MLPFRHITFPVINTAGRILHQLNVDEAYGFPFFRSERSLTHHAKRRATVHHVLSTIRLHIWTWLGRVPISTGGECSWLEEVGFTRLLFLSRATLCAASMLFFERAPSYDPSNTRPSSPPWESKDSFRDCCLFFGTTPTERQRVSLAILKSLDICFQDVTCSSFPFHF